MANFDANLTNKSPFLRQIVSMCSLTCACMARQLREQNEDFQLTTLMLIFKQCLAISFELYTPLFSFPVGIARFPFYFPSSFRSNLICSNIYMVITTKLDKCKCVCFQRVIMVSACFVTRSCAELLQ